MSLDIVKTLNWAIDTIRDKQMFGQDELGAALSRERRAKGAMIGAVKEIESLKSALLEVARINDEHHDFFSKGDNLHSFCEEYASLINRLRSEK